MRNAEIAKKLSVMAIYEAILGEEYKSRAYEKAGRKIDSMRDEVSDIYRKGGQDAIEAIPGVGKGIAKKIAELIKTGKSGHLEDLQEKIPVEVENLAALEGIGPKKVKVFWRKLGIKNVSQLEEAAKKQKIRNLEGFGKKSEEDVLQSIEFFKKRKGRFRIGEVYPMMEEIQERLQSVQGVKKVMIAGSARRMKDTVGDGDFLVSAKMPAMVIKEFCSMPTVIHVYSQGTKKASVKLENHMDADLKIVPE